MATATELSRRRPTAATCFGVIERHHAWTWGRPSLGPIAATQREWKIQLPWVPARRSAVSSLI
jgi:hypothetical protein